MGEAAHDQGGPAGLVGGTAAASGFTVKVFVEQQEVFPMRIGGVLGVRAVAGALALEICEEKGGVAAGEFSGDLIEGHEIA